MNAFTLKKLAVLLIASVLLSIAIIRTNSVDNVPFCIHSAGCNADERPRGQVITKNYGYPTTYKETRTFKPNDADERSDDYAGFVEATTNNKDFTPLNILINAAFWFSLLSLLTSFVKSRKRTETSAEPTAEAK